MKAEDFYKLNTITAYMARYERTIQTLDQKINMYNQQIGMFKGKDKPAPIKKQIEDMKKTIEDLKVRKQEVINAHAYWQKEERILIANYFDAEGLI